MKKFLVLLLISILAIFVFAGCTTPPANGGDDPGNGDEVVPPAMTFGKAYTNASGVTFVANDTDVTVTFSEPVDVEYYVYAAVKIDEGEYGCQVTLTPDANRTVWTGSLEPCMAECEECSFSPCEDPTDPNCGVICSCEPICISALVKHPCCAGEEVAVEVVTPDCLAPKVDLQMRFLDCNPCADPDPCVANCLYVEFTSLEAAGPCDDPEGCCEDDCSGIGEWKMTIGDDVCAEPCEIITGTDCPVEGESGCDCICFPTTGTSCVTMYFDIEDNVGNAAERRYWEICLDTDSIISFAEVDENGDEITPYTVTWDDVYGRTEWFTVIEGSCEEPDETNNAG